MSNSHSDLISIYYNSDSTRAKQTLAYATTENIQIHEIAILKTPLLGTKIIELAKNLGIEVANW
ncbi:hypothetical protein OAD66_04135 [Bacteroidia bacterium]|nr:hypothetical protein [Bacteroidia bacterium]